MSTIVHEMTSLGMPKAPCPDQICSQAPSPMLSPYFLSIPNRLRDQRLDAKAKLKANGIFWIPWLSNNAPCPPFTHDLQVFETVEASQALLGSTNSWLLTFVCRFFLSELAASGGQKHPIYGFRHLPSCKAWRIPPKSPCFFVRIGNKSRRV